MGVSSAALLAMTGIGAIGRLVNTVTHSALDYGYKSQLMDKSFDYKTQLMQKAYDYKIKQMKEGPKAMQEGLLGAGINPAAIYGGSGGYKAGQKIPTVARSIGTDDQNLINNGGITSTNARDYQYRAYTQAEIDEQERKKKEAKDKEIAEIKKQYRKTWFYF